MNEYLVRMSNCETGEICEQVINARTRAEAVAKFTRRWKRYIDNFNGAEWTVIVKQSF